MRAFPIPGLPAIVVVPVVVLDLGASGSIQAEVSADFSQQSTMSASIEYVGGQWSTGYGRTLQSTTDVSGLQGNASARVFLKPRIEFQFWGQSNAKGYVQAENYLELTATLFPVPGCSVGAGLSADAGMRLSVFNLIHWDAIYPDIFDYNTTLYTCAPFSCGSTSVLDASGNSYSVVLIGGVVGSARICVRNITAMGNRSRI
ncbi:MAG: hypothetical protein IPM46_05250 [Flavobacteriales bacterium]|nr:hypothetical protein [Flavobacteriales bacterium]